MANHLLSNEQKLDAIYLMLQKQEARERRKVWYLLFRWSLIFAVVYVIAIYPKDIMDRVSTMMRPFIIENVKSMMDYEKNDLFDEMKNILKSKDIVLPE